MRESVPWNSGIRVTHVCVDSVLDFVKLQDNVYAELRQLRVKMLLESHVQRGDVGGWLQAF